MNDGGTAADRRRWSAHPWRARSIRLLAYGLPVGLSLAFVHLATSVWSPPTASLWVFMLWWALVSLAATAVVWLVYALSRRLLPLGALLELSLVFPDATPSRLSLALRTGTVESLEDRLHLMRAAKVASTAQESAEILLRLVAALSLHDKITQGHAERVRAYAYLLGKRLGLSDVELDRLNWAALLHDIGKLEVSEGILNKPTKPTDEEWESLRLHPLYGETLVEPLREWLGEWADAVGYHHERWDGNGYPHGVSGEQIPRAGRIVAIADVYDVITSARSYKESASTAEARAELVRCAGTQFDPRYVRAFVDLALGRMRLVMGPLSWLSHAPLLARLPLTPSVGGALGGLAAAATVTATVAAVPDSPNAAVSAAQRPRPSVVVSHMPTPSPHVPRGKAAPSRPPVAGPKQAPSSAPAPAPGQPDATPAPNAPTPAPPAPEDPAAPAPPAPDHPAPDAPAPPAPEVPPAPPVPPLPPVPSPPPPPAPPPPNVPPSFNAGASQSVFEDAGAQFVAAWATAIVPGPAGESGQAVSFAVSTDNPGLFSAQPAVSPDGTLTYTPAANANGVATVTVTARDDGGTANGGVNSSGSATITVTVYPVNDAPTFAAGGNQVVVSLLGAQSVSGWASALSPGTSDESSQRVWFTVSTDAPGLFVTQPAISPDGTLTYRPRLLSLGVARVTVRAVDSGGTANGGVDSSPPTTFTITIV